MSATETTQQTSQSHLKKQDLETLVSGNRNNIFLSLICLAGIFMWENLGFPGEIKQPVDIFVLLWVTLQVILSFLGILMG